jgi:Ni2+-binding GTPase involved in maturation of urease and hydrogenase
MQLITVSGPPSSGKTSVIIQLAQCLKDKKLGVVKFDCLTSFDGQRYEEYGIPAKVGFSGKLCPDHFFVSNIQEVFDWGKRRGLDLLITESAGLCNRCSPHIRSVLSLCVIDNLSGINTPRKIGPMLKFADIVVITKGDVVSQAEREVFAYNVRQSNSKAKILFVNGITGQGAFMLAKYAEKAESFDTLEGMGLRFTMPSAICSYCTGETFIGGQFRLGAHKRLELDD